MQWVYEVALTDSQTAYKSLYLTYYQRLMRFTTLHLPSRLEAEEIVSDTFVAVWNNRKSLREITNFNSYIYTIAHHKIINYYRVRQMETVSLSDNGLDIFVHTETTPEVDLINKENITSLNDAINCLPDKCKIIFKLIREDKLKYKEVATILDISVKTVEAHLATAVRKLRDSLNKEIIT